MKNLKIHTILSILSLAAFLFSCSSREASIEESSVRNEPQGVSFTPDQVKEAGIVFGHFVEAELSHDVFAKGRLQLPNDRMAEANTFLGGMVSRIYIHHGAEVKKGQAICKLTHPDIIQLQQDYLNAKYELEVATQQYERQKKLVKEDIASKKNFQMAERDYLKAKTDFDALEMNARLAGFSMDALNKGEITDHLDIVSPIQGKVNKISVNLGQYVSPGESVAEIVDKSDLHVEMMVFEKDIPFIKPGQRVTLTLSNISDQVLEGKVFTVGSTMEETARTIPVLAHLNEMPPDAYPGMFISATIHTGESMFSALPEDAIIAEREGEYYVFYTTDDITSTGIIRFDKVRVNPGLIEDGYASMEVLDPLPENASIVVAGGYYIRSVMVRSIE